MRFRAIKKSDSLFVFTFLNLANYLKGSSSGLAINTLFFLFKSSIPLYLGSGVSNNL